MKELVEAEPALPVVSGLDGRCGGDSPFDAVELHREIDSDPDEAIEEFQAFQQSARCLAEGRSSRYHSCVQPRRGSNYLDCDRGPA